MRGDEGSTTDATFVVGTRHSEDDILISIADGNY